MCVKKKQYFNGMEILPMKKVDKYLFWHIVVPGTIKEFFEKCWKPIKSIV